MAGSGGDEEESCAISSWEEYSEKRISQAALDVNMMPFELVGGGGCEVL